MGKRKDASAAPKKVVAPKKPSLEEEALIKKVEVLVNDSNSVRGRDASIISVDADMLRVEADAMVLTDFGRELIDKQLKEVNDALAFEKNSGRFLQIVVRPAVRLRLNQISSQSLPHCPRSPVSQDMLHQLSHSGKLIHSESMPTHSESSTYIISISLASSVGASRSTVCGTMQWYKSVGSHHRCKQPFERTVWRPCILTLLAVRLHSGHFWCWCLCRCEWFRCWCSLSHQSRHRHFLLAVQNQPQSRQPLEIQPR